uniref:non-specific serine/threonine protein kinase n=1 Tax=Leersia perrieri TaxID=77586 RepID=A0A0D9VIP8_9ORYZ
MNPLTIILLCSIFLLYPRPSLFSQGKSSSSVGDTATTNKQAGALLSFRSMVSDPSGVLASWNASNHPYCRWRGVACGRRADGRVVALNLASASLSGPISPFLGNLSFLRLLNLSGNHLTGQIPPELGRLRRLRILGHPTGVGDRITGCTKLVRISLSFNSLHGEIPASLGNLSSLTVLSLANNKLNGEIPACLSNLSSLTFLNLESNMLYGQIPASLGNLAQLNALGLDDNQLSRCIPSSLGRLYNVAQLDLGYNNLTGSIPPMGVLPPNMFSTLPALKLFFASQNMFHGYLPSSLVNASYLSRFEVALNHFSGVISPELGGASGIWFSVNAFEANDSNDWEFMTALTNCSQLKILELEQNNLSGIIPDVISNLSLTVLTLATNKIVGHMPKEIGNLVNLTILTMHDNFLTGTLPSSLGTIPISLFNITTLSISLGISYNQLEGSIPPEVGNLQNIAVFDARYNQLSGEIPVTVGQCQILQKLYLQNNSFIRNIPSSLRGLKGLEILDLSGQIPKFLGNFSTLYDLNLSYNNFDGEVPVVGVFANATGISVQGHKKLCGGIQVLHLPPCPIQISMRRHKFSRLEIVVPLVATTIFILPLLLFFHTCYKKRLKKKSFNNIHERPSTCLLPAVGTCNRWLLNNQFVGYWELWISLQRKITPGTLKSFTTECEAMRNLKHRNLVKIITACSSIDFNGNDFKVVFDFIPNGCLEEWIHPHIDNQLGLEERHLNLVDPKNQYYLHFHGATPVVHCHLKPSNVLLDSDMVAHVGDFGIAKILSEGYTSFQPSTSSMGFRGTIGYAPPKYGAGNMVSTHGDIYSYGILVLEIVTGRRPTDNTFEQGLSLRKYIERALDNQVMDIVDNDLVRDIENVHATSMDDTSSKSVHSLISLLKLGMLCSEEMPLSRLSTKDIIKELLAIKRALA